MSPYAHHRALSNKELNNEKNQRKIEWAATIIRPFTEKEERAD